MSGIRVSGSGCCSFAFGVAVSGVADVEVACGRGHVGLRVYCCGELFDCRNQFLMLRCRWNLSSRA